MPSLKTFGTIPVSWFYKSGRATGLGQAFSRFWSAWASFGLPPRRQVGLEVKGRRTGRPHTLALVIAGHEGEQYLVSMLGECEWVKNVRASGEAHIISGRRRKVKLEEVGSTQPSRLPNPVSERAKPEPLRPASEPEHRRGIPSEGSWSEAATVVFSSSIASAAWTSSSACDPTPARWRAFT